MISDNQIIYNYRLKEKDFIQLKLGNIEYEKIMRMREKVNSILSLDKRKFEVEIAKLSTQFKDNIDITKGLISSFTENMGIDNQIEYIENKYKIIRELKDEFNLVYNNPEHLEYSSMQHLIKEVALLSITYLYKPTEMHKNISSIILSQIHGFSFSSQTYTKLDKEAKRNLLIKWGSHVNNLTVLCGYEPIFKESPVSLQVNFFRHLTFLEKIKRLWRRIIE